MSINIAALAVGIIAAFLLAFIVYGPALGLQRRWAEGTRIDPTPPSNPPLGSMILHIVMLTLLATIIAMTAATDSLGLAILAILAVAAQAVSVGAWAQKSGFAMAVDGGYAIGAGVLMILAHALL